MYRLALRSNVFRKHLIEEIIYGSFLSLFLSVQSWLRDKLISLALHLLYNFVLVKYNFYSLGFFWKHPLASDLWCVLHKWISLEFVAAATFLLWLSAQSTDKWNIYRNAWHCLPAVQFSGYLVIWLCVLTILFFETVLTIVAFWSSIDCVMAIQIRTIA